MAKYIVLNDEVVVGGVDVSHYVDWYRINATVGEIRSVTINFLDCDDVTINGRTLKQMFAREEKTL